MTISPEKDPIVEQTEQSRHCERQHLIDRASAKAIRQLAYLALWGGIGGKEIVNGGPGTRTRCAGSRLSERLYGLRYIPGCQNEDDSLPYIMVTCFRRIASETPRLLTLIPTLVLNDKLILRLFVIRDGLGHGTL